MPRGRPPGSRGVRGRGSIARGRGKPSQTTAPWKQWLPLAPGTTSVKGRVKKTTAEKYDSRVVSNAKYYKETRAQLSATKYIRMNVLRYYPLYHGHR